MDITILLTALFEVAKCIFIVGCWYFGFAFVIMWLVWPINDNDQAAPIYVICRGFKRAYLSVIGIFK